jgi:hypothetical protein
VTSSRKEIVELSVGFLLLGAVFAGLGLVLSALWRPLP